MVYEDNSQRNSTLCRAFFEIFKSYSALNELLLSTPGQQYPLKQGRCFYCETPHIILTDIMTATQALERTPENHIRGEYR